MKLFRNIKLMALGAAVLVSACEPIEDRDTLSNSFDPDNIELEVVQSTPGGNGLTLKMNTPGVIGFWDYNINTAYTDEVKVNYPIPGEQTFTYSVATAYMPNGDPGETEYIEKSVTVNIEVLDQPLPEAYYALVGQDLGGKTWVFDGGPAADGRQWWFMSDPGNPWGIWWNAAGDCCPPADAAGKMVFDLDRAANFIYYADAAGDPVTGGTFTFNSDYTKLTIGGGTNLLGTIPGSGGGNAGVYQIVELTADRMVLFVPDAEWATGWTWVFVPEA
ncbi:hypothetical protein [Reichenbachiella ulvae]|uniref:Uncharacterized protein n=1 Tax=Reichenbachiella ulvae TaxID=2980104 RepID=A0ABT3CZR7_9BACT|nr:hypothetical protein [Reichenbachiella ulvae]MCV9389193.1 hypothetical protein [Reichenbachiella ulvae]